MSHLSFVQAQGRLTCAAAPVTAPTLWGPCGCVKLRWPLCHYPAPTLFLHCNRVREWLFKLHIVSRMAVQVSYRLFKLHIVSKYGVLNP